MSSIQQYTGIAWGQSQLDASPLNMARVAGIVANDGRLSPTRFVLNDSPKEQIEVIDPSSARLLASAMAGESSKWIDRKIFPSSYKDNMGGKTGTPMRAYKGKNVRNDGWYICYIKNPDTNRIFSIALRLERLPQGMVSTEAVKFMADVVIPVLQECQYLK